MNQHVFAPLGIPASACKPAGMSEILSYPLPPGSTHGDPWGDWSLMCGSGGWVLKAGDVFKVINDLANGNVLLTNDEKSQMNYPNCLGWDCSVRPDCPNPFVCKNGDLFNGNGISVWTYAGIFKSNVPVVVYVNSFLPSPYQPYDSNGNSIQYANLCTASGVPFGCCSGSGTGMTCVPCPAGQACGEDIIGLVATAYSAAGVPPPQLLSGTCSSQFIPPGYSTIPPGYPTQTIAGNPSLDNYHTATMETITVACCSMNYGLMVTQLGGTPLKTFVPNTGYPESNFGDVFVIDDPSGALAGSVQSFNVSGAATAGCTPTSVTSSVTIANCAQTPPPPPPQCSGSESECLCLASGGVIGPGGRCIHVPPPPGCGGGKLPC
jgi:hypothetical protein